MKTCSLIFLFALGLLSCENKPRNVDEGKDEAIPPTMEVRDSLIIDTIETERDKTDTDRDYR